jgi:integrase
VTNLDLTGIDRLSSGKYRVRIQHEKHRVKVPLCSTPEEAVALRTAILAEIESGKVVAVGGITAAQWGHTWLRKYRSTNRNYKTDVSRFDTHLATAEWARRPLVSVEAGDIIAWLNELREKRVGYLHGRHRNVRKLGFASRKHCVNLARMLFSDAITEGLIKSNPVLGVRLKKSDDDRIFDRVPEEWPLKPEEMAKLSEALGDDPERSIIWFAIGTGMRQGEMWNLQLADVHVDGPQPYINVRFGSRGRLPKNGRVRKVPLFGIGLEAAVQWLKVLPKYAPTNPDGLMFPTPYVPEQKDRTGRRRHEGGALRYAGKVPLAWTEAKVVLGRRVWWHLLRHTCATGLLCGYWGTRWRLEDVGKLLGHSSVRTTEMYAHLLDSTLTELAAETHARWTKNGGGQGGGGGQLSRGCHGDPSPIADPAGKPSAPQRIRTSDLRLRRGSLNSGSGCFAPE